MGKGVEGTEGGKGGGKGGAVLDGAEARVGVRRTVRGSGSRRKTHRALQYYILDSAG